MTRPTLPNAFEVQQMLSGLLNRQVKVSLAEKPIAATAMKDFYYGLYDDGKGEMVALWQSDFVVSAALGAALTLLPKNLAEAAAKDKKFGEELHDNFREVVNIGASIFHTQRVRLVHFAPCSSSKPVNLEAFLHLKGKTTALRVDVSGFFAGTLLLSVLAPDET